jgi:UDP-glucose 4-epimerase
MNNTKSALVTGCAGFIGSNFVRRFAQRNSESAIIGIDDFSTGKRECLPSDANTFIFYEGSVLNTALLGEIFAKHQPEYIFHFAALPRVSYSVEHPLETSLANISGTIALLEAAKNYKAKRFILSSSSSVYGNTDVMPTRESEPPNPESPYALQKYVSELWCRHFSILFGLDTVALRYFNVYGPGQYGDSPYSTVVSAWLERYFNSQLGAPFIEGDGKQSRDFCYVDDVAEANMLAMSADAKFAGEVINIAGGGRTSLLEVKELLEKYLGEKLTLEARPPRVGDVRHTQADLSKAEKLLGYKPRVSFEEGLRKTIEWFHHRDEV